MPVDLSICSDLLIPRMLFLTNPGNLFALNHLFTYGYGISILLDAGYSVADKTENESALSSVEINRIRMQ